jgi:hypothetical protein
LEYASIVEWPFQLWDSKTKCTIKATLEKFNKIKVEAFVVLMVNVSLAWEKQQKVEAFASNGHVVIEKLES